MFTELLANGLNKYITSIIHTHQTGFVPNRFSFFNVISIHLIPVGADVETIMGPTSGDTP